MNMSDFNMVLQGHFLISMPQLADRHFVQTLTFVCEHSAQGAMGLVINRPLELNLAEMLEHLEVDCRSLKSSQSPVFSGGPVEVERGFVLHEDDGRSWKSSYRVPPNLAVTTSLDVLEAMGRGEGPPRALVALGYAGWGAGQLEREMTENSWLSCPADPEIIFDLEAGDRLAAAAAGLGVDLNLLGTISGHA